MDWEKVSAALYQSAKRLQAEQLKVPASNVAATAAVGAAALVCGELSAAIDKGLAASPRLPTNAETSSILSNTLNG